MNIRIPLLLTLALSVAACSGMAKRDTTGTDMERYMDYAGQPIDRFTYLGRFDGWTTVAPDKLIIWSGANEAYLLSVSGCSDLQFASRIAITTSIAGTVRDDQDSVRVGRQSCRITEIRPIDYQGMSKAK